MALTMLAWSWLGCRRRCIPNFAEASHSARSCERLVATAKEPLSRGYTLALTVTFGALVAYISSIQQIVFEAFDSPEILGIVFGAIAAPMALASWTNARVVGRFGLRRVGHGATVAFASSLRRILRWRLRGWRALRSFIVLQALTMVSSSFAVVEPRHAGDGPNGRDRRHRFVRSGRCRNIGPQSSAMQSVRHSMERACPSSSGMAACATTAFIIVILTEPKRLFAGPSAAAERGIARAPRSLGRLRTIRQRYRRRPSGADHQCFADFLGLAADRTLDALGNVRIFLEIDLGVLAALPMRMQS